MEQVHDPMMSARCDHHVEALDAPYSDPSGGDNDTPDGVTLYGLTFSKGNHVDS